MQHYCVLDNIRSAHNVGSIFRTADGAGITKMFLCGYTPTPIDRFGRTQKEIAKVALSAHETMPWEYYEDILQCLTNLKATGVQIVAVEQTPHAASYKTFSTSDRPSAFVFGNEREGVHEAALELADAVIDIPMHGSKESLNVSVAAGIILFHVL